MSLEQHLTVSNFLPWDCPAGSQKGILEKQYSHFLGVRTLLHCYTLLRALKSIYLCGLYFSTFTVLEIYTEKCLKYILSHLKKKVIDQVYK